MKLFFAILINNFAYLMQWQQIQIAITRADFARTSVTLQSNSISTQFLLIVPKEVFTSKIVHPVMDRTSAASHNTNPNHGVLNYLSREIVHIRYLTN